MENYYAITESELKKFPIIEARKLEVQKMTRCRGVATYRLMTLIEVQEE